MNFLILLNIIFNIIIPVTTMFLDMDFDTIYNMSMKIAAFILFITSMLINNIILKILAYCIGVIFTQTTGWIIVIHNLPMNYTFSTKGLIGTITLFETMFYIITFVGLILKFRQVRNYHFIPKWLKYSLMINSVVFSIILIIYYICLSMIEKIYLADIVVGIYIFSLVYVLLCYGLNQSYPFNPKAGEKFIVLLNFSFISSFPILFLTYDINLFWTKCNNTFQQCFVSIITSNLTLFFTLYIGVSFAISAVVRILIFGDEDLEVIENLPEEQRQEQQEQPQEQPIQQFYVAMPVDESIIIQQDVQDSNDESCVICLETKKSKYPIIYPCAHSIICNECIIKSRENLKICPLCRMKIEHYILPI